MSATTDLTAQLRAEVLRLEDDLRAQLGRSTDRDAQWRTEHREATVKQRTAESWEGWRDERITQVAVAWVLTTVFVRFCEDNALVAPVWITGPGGRRQEAIDAQQEFLRRAARDGDVTDREWLLEAIGYLRGLRATANLVDDTSPLWLLSPSGDAATRLLDFWRERDNDGTPVRDLSDAQLDTRFLGDVYQDLSVEAKKRYALLQTPVFVEEFILDRTLEPALAERPLEGFKLIDPTCGSGHFLLGAFARFLDRWHREAPGMDERERVQKALDSVYGVDINPFAVAIARFRLTVAALQASGFARLEDAPAFDYHLAVGNSLLHGSGQRTLADDSDLDDFAYQTEDSRRLKMILADQQYDTVVGNPPYIDVSDSALNAAYRRRYTACKGTYALAVPFMERFFGLAKTTDGAGWVGQITSNSFMKREFGDVLIEKFLNLKDLRLIVDSSGVFLPGHGTPTVIIIGLNQRPLAKVVRAVLGVRGEPGTPADPASGKVWTSITENIDQPGWSDQWVTVADLQRSSLQQHPWTLAGGGAIELLAALQDNSTGPLSSHTRRVGFMAMSHADDAFTYPSHKVSSSVGDDPCFVPLVAGKEVRDYSMVNHSVTWFPYSKGQIQAPSTKAGKLLWPLRTDLGSRALFGNETYFNEGRSWWAWHQVPADEGASEMSIAFAEVATHNHFAIDRGNKVLKQTAPVIKFSASAPTHLYFDLLGILNSSAICFWLKQKCQKKGGDADQPWARTYQFNSSNVGEIPLPSAYPSSLSFEIDQVASALAEHLPDSDFANGVPTLAALEQERKIASELRSRLIYLQEELDWNVYAAFGLTDLPFTDTFAPTGELELGQRAFEITLAQRLEAGEEPPTTWFDEFGATCTTASPENWSQTYRELVERRLEEIDNNPFLRVLEQPEFKRPWFKIIGTAYVSWNHWWEKQEERALRGWLLDRLEDRKFWFDRQDRPAPKSVQQLADEVSRDADLSSVLALWEGRPDVPVVDSLTKLLSTEAVPYLAAYRYKEPGLRKRAAWEHTWALQRKEDAGEKLDGPIPVPPRYTTADFTRTEYWSHRGKLDMPKERFILYSNAGRDTDPTALLGWAGWDHTQQSLALAGLLQQRTNDGWTDDRLIPLVAGLAELLPWVRQWHHEPDDAYGGTSPAEFFADQLDQRTAQVSSTLEQLSAWRPEPATRGRRRKSIP